MRANICDIIKVALTIAGYLLGHDVDAEVVTVREAVLVLVGAISAVLFAVSLCQKTIIFCITQNILLIIITLSKGSKMILWWCVK